MTFDASTLESHLASVQKRYPNSVGNDIDRNPERISTGSISLDYITGGGIPIGHNTMFWGDYGSGKSLTSWGAAREAQKMWPGEPVAYYNLERQYHPEFAEAHGVNTDPKSGLIVVDGNVIESVGTMMQTLLGSVRLHIVDSVSEGIALDALNKDIEASQQPGSAARAWQNVLLHLKPFINPENAIIWISQSRDNIGGYGDPSHPTGGQYMSKFLPDLRVRFSKGAYLYYDKDGFLAEERKDNSARTFSGMQEADGIVLKAKVDKARICKPFRSCEMYLDLNKYTFDYIYELQKAAKHYGIVEKSGAWFKLPDGTTAHGSKGLREALAADVDLQDAVKKAMKEA